MIIIIIEIFSSTSFELIFWSGEEANEARLAIYHMTYNMVGYSMLYEVRLTMYHMTYNMVGYSIMYEVRLIMFHMTYNML